MLCALWLLFLAVLAVSATSPAQTIRRAGNLAAVPNTTFITTQGGQFFVNGSVFHANGTNAYWLSALNSEKDINDTLASIRADNFTVVRTWAFNDVEAIPENGTWFQLIANGTLTINDGPNGLQKLDKVIELAQNHGLYVILSLTNNWNPSPTDPSSGTDQPLPSGFNAIKMRQMAASNTTLPRNVLSNSYGGMDAYVRNFGGPQEHDQFFTNQTLINAFLNYTDQVVSRYINNTSVFSWEIANDPRCNSTLHNNPSCMTQNVTQWHNTVAQRVSNMDPNHVVSAGSQGFICMNCTKLFPRTQLPAAQVSPVPGSRRSIPEPQSKAKLLKERKAAWKRQRERQKRAGIQPDGVKIRGRWTASQTKRQSDLDSVMSALDGSHGVDSADILNVPNISFSSFQLFPDQFNYSQHPPDPTLPAFNQTLEIGLEWISLQADLAKLFGKPLILTGFGLVTQDNAPFFVPFNSTMAPFGPDSPTPVNVTQPFGVTNDQRNDAYEQWIQAAITGGIQGILQYQWTQDNLTTQPGTAISPNNNETSQSPLPTVVGQSPNDGYGDLSSADEAMIGSDFTSPQGFAPDNS